MHLPPALVQRCTSMARCGTYGDTPQLSLCIQGQLHARLAGDQGLKQLAEASQAHVVIHADVLATLALTQAPSFQEVRTWFPHVTVQSRCT